MATSKPPPYGAAHFALELDNNTDGGLFRSIEGGGVKSDVMTYQQGGIYDRWRQVGKVKFEDIKLQVGMSMSQMFYTWVADFFSGKASRKDGAIVAADFWYKARARREFKAAMIKELAFPKLEGKDTSGSAYMTVTIAVEELQFLKGDEQKLTQSALDNQKTWSANNFVFTIDGFETSTHECSKVDGFTVKQNIVEYHSGGRRSPTLTPSGMDFPNISFYLPEPYADPLLDWYKNRAMERGKPAGKLLNGSITTHDNDSTELFTLSFYNADIVNVSVDKADAASEEIKQIKFDLFTERMEFKNVETSGGNTTA